VRMGGGWKRLGSCPVAGYGISGVEPSGSCTIITGSCYSESK
jgi:hypothetical protein